MTNVIVSHEDLCSKAFAFKFEDNLFDTHNTLQKAQNYLTARFTAVLEKSQRKVHNIRS